MKKLVLLLTLVNMTACGYIEDKNSNDRLHQDITNLQGQVNDLRDQLAVCAAEDEVSFEAGYNCRLALGTIADRIAELEALVNRLRIDVAVQQGYTSIVEVIDVCGNDPAKVDEVLLKLSNGTLLASFSDSASGTNTRFSVLGAGNYQTTDSTLCNFTVHADNSVTW